MKSLKMKISIITAIYNNANYIETCLKSVHSQTYKNIEHIVIDGGSFDGTLEKIKYSTYKVQNFTLLSQKDNGIYDALNKGIASATGDVIGFLHSDDILYHEKVIEKVAKMFDERDIDSVYSDIVYVFEDDIDKVLRYWKSGNYKSSLLMHGWMPPHPSFFVRKRIYDKYGGFNQSLKISSDYEIVLRFLGKYKISTAYLPEMTVKMRSGGMSNKSFINICHKSMEDYKALKMNGMPLALYTLVMKNLRKVSQFVIK